MTTVATPTAAVPPRSLAPALMVTGAAALFAVTLGVARFASAAQSMTGGFFAVDDSARLFLLLVNAVYLGVAVHVWSRAHADEAFRTGISRYAGFSIAFIAASNLALASNHLIVGWVFLELTTLAAVPLIQKGGTEQQLFASWKYFLFSGVGLGLALLGFACLGRSLGSSGHEVSYFLDAIAREGAAPPDLWWRVGVGLVILGYGTKLGLAPMYAWLPETYCAAPPATTALLAAVQFNVALLGLLRVMQFVHLRTPALISYELIALGLLTMAISSLSIIACQNYKKLIAYASLNHAGVIAIGLGVGGEASYGVVLYLVSNAFIKAILFLTVGRISALYRTDDMREVSGLVKDLPYSGIFFMVGTFALLGFPPFGSFVGELVIISGLVSRGLMAVFVAFCVILTLTFVATGRSMFPMIWGESKKPMQWRTQPLRSVIPKVVFLAALVSMGLYLPRPINDLFLSVASTLGAP